MQIHRTKKNTTILMIIIVIFLNNQCGTIQLSEYQGKENWYVASKKCTELGTRLPTREELKAAYKTDQRKILQGDGFSYWTSEEYDKDFAYYVGGRHSIMVGNAIKDFHKSVRCIR